MPTLSSMASTGPRLWRGSVAAATAEGAASTGGVGGGHGGGGFVWGGGAGEGAGGVAGGAGGAGGGAGGAVAWGAAAAVSAVGKEDGDRVDGDRWCLEEDEAARAAAVAAVEACGAALGSGPGGVDRSGGPEDEGAG